MLLAARRAMVRRRAKNRAIARCTMLLAVAIPSWAGIAKLILHHKVAVLIHSQRKSTCHHFASSPVVAHMRLVCQIAIVCVCVCVCVDMLTHSYAHVPFSLPLSFRIIRSRLPHERTLKPLITLRESRNDVRKTICRNMRRCGW